MLNPGDVVVLCTDGVTGAGNRQETEALGDLALNRDTPSPKVADSLLERALLAAGGTIMDDMVIFVLSDPRAGGSRQSADPPEGAASSLQ